MVLMVGERLLPVPMNRMHITEHELNYALRRAGITHRSQVARVVCEPNGEPSVLRHGAPLDPKLLFDVANAEAIPATQGFQLRTLIQTRMKAVKVPPWLFPGRGCGV